MAFVLPLTNPANRRFPRQEVYVFKDVLADSLAGPGSSPEHPLNRNGQCVKGWLVVVEKTMGILVSSVYL